MYGRPIDLAKHVLWPKVLSSKLIWQEIHKHHEKHTQGSKMNKIKPYHLKVMANLI